MKHETQAPEGADAIGAALQTARCIAAEALENAMRAFAGHPNKYVSEQRDLAEIDAGIAAHRAALASQPASAPAKNPATTRVCGDFDPVSAPAPAEAPEIGEVTWQQAADAIENLDDYARMMVGVDPSGPRETLYRFLEQAKAALASKAQPKGTVGEEHRAAFEASWNRRNHPVPINSRRHADGRYADHRIEREWTEWKERHGVATVQAPAPAPGEALARINAYIARRKAARGIDIERIHGFDPGHERSAELLLSDLEAVALQAPAVAPTQAAQDVLAERQRQVEREGYTLQHDADMHDSNDLARAAAFYAMAEVGYEYGRVSWPWDEDVCKVKDRYRNFVRAAALLIAAADVERARSHVSDVPVHPMGDA